jgi:hypothetical protein
MPSWISIGASRETSRLMIGRSCSASPSPCPNWSAKASISLAKPNSCALGHRAAIRSVATPGLTTSMAASIHSRALR